MDGYPGRKSARAQAATSMSDEKRLSQRRGVNTSQDLLVLPHKRSSIKTTVHPELTRKYDPVSDQIKWNTHTVNLERGGTLLMRNDCNRSLTGNSVNNKSIKILSECTHKQHT